MKFTIEFDTGNAAFEHDARQECTRILRELAERVQDWSGSNDFTMLVTDINGNKIGHLKVRK